MLEALSQNLALKTIGELCKGLALKSHPPKLHKDMLREEMREPNDKVHVAPELLDYSAVIG